MARIQMTMSLLLVATLVACRPPSEMNEAELEAAEMEFVEAQVGVGKKGQSLKDREGLYVTPVKAYFSTQQRVVFEFQIPPAIRMYKAEKGHAPLSHEEFMTEIIEANQIQLPELPDGHQYIYDPDREELMVKRPKQK